jgi:peptide/nickel transport system ATP-binding protein
MLHIENLSVSFSMYQEAGLKKHGLRVIADLSLDLRAGEVLAVAGSSGSGKSLLAHAIIGLLPRNANIDGTVLFKGEPLDDARYQKIRGREIVLVPQSIAYLDPLMKAGRQVSRNRAQQQEVFGRLGLDKKAAGFYPHQLSGGMARRVLIATALAKDADLVIADEPTPGLDASLAADALGMLRTIADEGKSVLLITHDIDLASIFADRIAVLYAGSILEIATASDFESGRVSHPYSLALRDALPQNSFEPISGSQPYAGDLPNGCLFAPRCPKVMDICNSKMPPMCDTGNGKARCFLYET